MLSIGNRKYTPLKYAGRVEMTGRAEDVQIGINGTVGIFPVQSTKSQLHQFLILNASINKQSNKNIIHLRHNNHLHHLHITSVR